jgi:D-aminopeptidase
MTRARDLGIPFLGTPGKWNAITDVTGVLVGHTTLNYGKGPLVRGVGPVRTGVTVVMPRSKTLEPVFAGWYSLNGNGEMTGTTWVEESGFLRGPIGITNTHSVGVVRDAIVEWILTACMDDPSLKQFFFHLPVVAETFDGTLNDVNGFHVEKEHVYEALENADDGKVEEGNVGGGTGMVCHRFKGGIGTASRKLDESQGGYTVGVLVQANYGGREELTIAGVPVGREITDLMPEIHAIDIRYTGTSIIVVVATNAPLLPHQLKRIARRVPLGIARVGGHGHNSSGDIFIAFSTANEGAYNSNGASNIRMVANEQIEPLFDATVQATEEAILNALVSAKTMKGINDNQVYALPHDRVREILKKYNRLVE